MRLLLVLVSALLASAAFAPLSWWYLSVVAWIPLFMALEGVSVKVGGRLGLLHGLIFFGLTMAWLAKVFSGAWWMMIPLVFVISSFTMLFGAGYAALVKRHGSSWQTAVGGALWWMLAEFVRCEIFILKFPWMTPGVGLGPNWVSPVLGVYGISFLVVLGGMLFCQRGKYSLLGGTLVIGMLLSTMLRPAPHRVEGDGVRVLAVQAETVEGTMLVQMADGLAKDVDIVLYPEYAFPMDVPKVKWLFDEMKTFSKEHDAILVFGMKTELEGEQFYNTALTLDGDEIVGKHYKNHTVHFFADGIAGTEAKPVETRHGKFGTPICFDCDYEDTVRRMTANGAEYFIVPSLDAMSWGVQQHVQHAELFRHRAAENGRWMIVCAGSGTTQLIDDHGNRIVALPLMEEALLDAVLEKKTGLTFFTRAGWLFPWVAMSAGAIWMLWLIATSFMRKNRGK